MGLFCLHVTVVTIEFEMWQGLSASENHLCGQHSTGGCGSTRQDHAGHLKLYTSTHRQRDMIGLPAAFPDLARLYFGLVASLG